MEFGPLDHGGRHYLDFAWSSVIAGEARGQDAVIERIQLALGYGVKIELEQIFEGINDFAIAMHHTAQRGRLTIDLRVVNVVRLRDRKIFAIHTHFSDVEMIDNFFVRLSSGQGNFPVTK